MRVGSKVRVVSPWDTHCGLRGEVTQMVPYVMVRLFHERLPIRFSERDLITEEESTPHLTAGE